MPWVYGYSSYQIYSSYTYTYASGTYNYTAYATGTGTNYNQYVRIMKSVSGVVSEVTNWLLSTSATIASFRVKTSGTNITVQAYTDNNLTNQLGADLTYNASTATPTGKYGISLKPSSYNQGYVIATSTNIARN